MPAVAQKGKATIVVTAAHADAIVVRVESDSRRYDDVESFWFAKYTSNRLPDSEPVALEFRVGLDFAKQHFCAAAQNRHENALICAPGALDDFTRIDLVVHGQETTE